jgi:RimJ/RimL family protein N-acetyltransferase
MKLPATLTIETPRCLLRIVDASDIPFIFDASRHPGFCNHMTWNPPATAADLQVPLKNNLDAWAAGDAYTFTIFFKSGAGRVGRITIRRGENACWNIGYWTHPIHQGRGLMTEAAAEILRFGFQQLGARLIESKHVVGNAPSRRVLEKIGLRFAEHLPRGFQKNGEWLAEDRLELSREEFDARTQVELNFRFATEADCPQIAEWNHQLIRDEGHRNPMTVAELEQRMRGWLAGEYRAVIFQHAAEAVAYALYREQPEEIYLRQMFVIRLRRRRGIGRQAVELLRSRIWPADKRLTVEVLAANQAAVSFWRGIGFCDYALTLEIMPENQSGESE